MCGWRPRRGRKDSRGWRLAAASLSGPDPRGGCVALDAMPPETTDQDAHTAQRSSVDDDVGWWEPSEPAVTAADVPRWMARNDGRGRIVELVQLCKDWARLPGPREAMIAEPPRRWRWYHRFGPRRHDLARIAAVIHALCDRDGHAVPGWVHQHRSDRPLFFDGSPMCDSDYHNVFFDPPSIEDIRVHGIADPAARNTRPTPTAPGMSSGEQHCSPAAVTIQRLAAGCGDRRAALARTPQRSRAKRITSRSLGLCDGCYGGARQRMRGLCQPPISDRRQPRVGLAMAPFGSVTGIRWHERPTPHRREPPCPPCRLVAAAVVAAVGGRRRR